jgi:hypothetical protein
MLFATPNDRLRADSYVLGRTEVELVKFARCSNSGVGEVKKGRGSTLSAVREVSQQTERKSGRGWAWVPTRTWRWSDGDGGEERGRTPRARFAPGKRV